MAARKAKKPTIASALGEIERSIKNGRPKEALEAIDRLRPRVKGANAARLRKLEGLANARLGHVERARTIFRELLDQGGLDADGHGIYGRTSMDLYDRTNDRKLLRESRDLYAKGLELAKSQARKNYLGINAAAKSLFLGEREKAERAEAERYCCLVDASLASGPPEKKDRYWYEATAAEVLLIRGDYDGAAERYAKAVRMEPRQHGSHSQTWLQARRILRAQRAGSKEQNKIWRAFRHLTDAPPRASVAEPPYRRLRVYAFDPSLARRMATSTINEVTLTVPWEPDRDDETPPFQPLPGPTGEYLEVVDYDPASGCYYEPIDLDDRWLLAADGVAPSEGDPHFHQQMVYAVAMNVIAHFERALGRRALWAPRLIRDEKSGKVIEEQFVRRLRIYPHALREANAYYSPDKKALLFGYFPAESDDPTIIPGGTVFSCLSHDVIAHEVSHALLDGLHPRFAEASNEDVLAFHEAFADVVALFQHFSHPEVLRYEIARSRGDLAAGSILGQLAQQFGRAIGNYGALRDAIGEIDPETKEWRPKKPDPDELARTEEPHARGAILVSAIFDAFLTIYRARISDLLRIASQGSGILDPGEIHPDLVERLAAEASKTATHVLHICIRALDYCPPVDMTFGDYLRAVITADVDMVPDDRRHYRLAIIEAFQRRGIYPDDVSNLSVESLVWRPPRGDGIDLTPLFRDTDGGPTLKPEWKPTADRRHLWQTMRDNARAVRHWLVHHCTPTMADELGLVLSVDAPGGVYRHERGKARGVPTVEVHSVRVARRSTPTGELVTDLVVEILQRRRGYCDELRQRRVDRGRGTGLKEKDVDFKVRGGCTLLIDPDTCRVRYAVTKHILSEGRMRRHRGYLTGQDPSLRAIYFGATGRDASAKEPFAMLHRPV